MKALSVSELNSQLQVILGEHFSRVCVRGEIANLTKHQSSGHYYFSLKDEESSIKCALFRGVRAKLDLEIEQGMEVEVSGSVSLYAKRGEYQIICSNIIESGKGKMQFEKIKEKLNKLGYFDKKKKPLMKFPKRIALVTSISGAALQDMKFVANKRWSGVDFDIFDTLVQGVEAKYSIARNIALADKMDYDIIIISRGGGSEEDLWAFNEEVVAEAIFRAKTPIISAVGHEIDFVISDFVADLRAPTPSACMEMILQDKNEWLLKLSDELDTLNNIMNNKFNALAQVISSLKNQISHFNFDYIRLKRELGESSQMLNMLFANLLHNKLNKLRDISKLNYSGITRGVNELVGLKRELENSLNLLLKNKQNEIMPQAMLDSTLKQMLEQKAKELEYSLNMLTSLNPALLCKKGFVQVTQNGVVKSLDELKSNDEVLLSNGEQNLEAIIK